MKPGYKYFKSVILDSPILIISMFTSFVGNHTLNIFDKIVLEAIRGFIY